MQARVPVKTFSMKILIEIEGKEFICETSWRKDVYVGMMCDQWVMFPEVVTLHMSFCI